MLVKPAPCLSDEGRKAEKLDRATDWRNAVRGEERGVLQSRLHPKIRGSQLRFERLRWGWDTVARINGSIIASMSPLNAPTSLTTLDLQWNITIHHISGQTLTWKLESCV